jgi:predicted Zn-dependent protease
LARADEAIENATIEMIAGILAGIAAGVVARDPGPAVVVGSAARMMALRDLMQYTREQEGVADQAAYRLLERTGQSPAGLLSFFKLLERQEALSSAQQDPFLRSHPLTQSRIDAAEAAVARSPYANRADSPEMLLRHQRMLAKLNGYLLPMSRVMAMYPQVGPQRAGALRACDRVLPRLAL